MGRISKGQRVDENSQPCHTVSRREGGRGGRSSYEAYTGVSVWKAGRQNVKPGETFSLNSDAKGCLIWTAQKKKKNAKAVITGSVWGISVLQWHLQFDHVLVCGGQHGETLRRKGISEARIGGLRLTNLQSHIVGVNKEPN